jgi:hypothetical protein
MHTRQADGQSHRSFVAYRNTILCVTVELMTFLATCTDKNTRHTTKHIKHSIQDDRLITIMLRLSRALPEQLHYGIMIANRLLHGY